MKDERFCKYQENNEQVLYLYCFLLFLKAIVGYRETEKTTWSEKNQHILKKIKDVGFKPTDSVLDATHILDLADDG